MCTTFDCMEANLTSTSFFESLKLPLCFRNFQTAKLRLDFVEIWQFYCQSNFMRMVNQTLFYNDFGSQKACSWCNSWRILNRLLIFLLTFWIVFNTATLKTIQNKNKIVSNRFKNQISCKPIREPAIIVKEGLIQFSIDEQVHLPNMVHC